MKRNNNPTDHSAVFWKISKEFISHRLPEIRKSSPNTVKAYRESLNNYIDYLESEKNIDRVKISFEDFCKSNILDYLDWMLNTRKYAAATCNLRLSAINSLLEYAANEDSIKHMPLFLESQMVKGPKNKPRPIEYFEGYQMEALLAAPDQKTRTGRRNMMMLILYYDTAARISELLTLNMAQLHLETTIPYVTILGKGRKYRNVPLMDKTVLHLRQYIKEFHSGHEPDTPLFYARTHGRQHPLSCDTVELMIKRYSIQCEKAGITMPDKPHCHMVRKTRAMDLYKNGMPLSHIQQMLGHENISTTSGFYAFVTIDTLAKSMSVASEENLSTEKKWDDEEILKRIYSL